MFKIHIPIFYLDLKQSIQNTKFLFIKVNDKAYQSDVNLLVYTKTTIYGKSVKYNFTQHLKRLIGVFLTENDINKKIYLNKKLLNCYNHSKGFICYNNLFCTDLLVFLKGEINDLTYKVFFEDVFRKSFINLELPIYLTAGELKKIFKEIILALKDIISSFYY
jgi:hypothetical protein